MLGRSTKLGLGPGTEGLLQREVTFRRLTGDEAPCSSILDDSSRFRRVARTGVEGGDELAVREESATPE